MNDRFDLTIPCKVCGVEIDQYFSMQGNYVCKCTEKKQSSMIHEIIEFEDEDQKNFIENTIKTIKQSFRRKL